MDDSGERFRRLRRKARAEGPEDPVRERTGDLFAHFGVEVGPIATPAAEPAAREAAPCRACGWYVLVVPSRAGDPTSGCPNCAEPEPLPRAPGTPR
jgi:hypothetical protein